METISRDDQSWLAGILDGEGYFGLGEYGKKRTGKRLRITISNTDPRLHQRVSRIYVSLGITFYWYLRMPRTPSEKQFMEIIVMGNNPVKRLLNSVGEFLTAKKEQADAMKEYLAWRDTQPASVGHNETVRMAIEARFSDLGNKLKGLRKASWSLQRLPRRASEVLNLENLEVVV